MILVSKISIKPTFFWHFEKEDNYMKKCVVLEMENKIDCENAMNDYLSDGYKVEASSCNSKYYKSILILEEND